MKKIIIAIDGPAGAGKSTIAKKVAARLGYAYIDTGAMYRTVTLCFLESSQPFSEEAVTHIANRIDIAFQYRDGVNRVFVDGREVTDEIRSLEVSQNVSKVAAVGGVRTAMVAAQRKIGEKGGVVMDGRDIGTVVLPKATVKIFLTATPEVRAKRRTDELIAKGQKADYNKILKDIQQRDYQDTHRAIAPLKMARDSVRLDTSELDIDGVIAAMKEIIARKVTL